VRFQRPLQSRHSILHGKKYSAIDYWYKISQQNHIPLRMSLHRFSDGMQDAKGQYGLFKVNKSQ
jgi:hypothetical protein